MRADISVLRQPEGSLQQRQRLARIAAPIVQPPHAVEDGRIVRFTLERRRDQPLRPRQLTIVIRQQEAERVGDRAVLRPVTVERFELRDRGSGAARLLEQDGLLVEQIRMDGKRASASSIRASD